MADCPILQFFEVSAARFLEIAAAEGRYRPRTDAFVFKLLAPTNAFQPTPFDPEHPDGRWLFLSENDEGDFRKKMENGLQGLGRTLAREVASVSRSRSVLQGGDQQDPSDQSTNAPGRFSFLSSLVSHSQPPLPPQSCRYTLPPKMLFVPAATQRVADSDASIRVTTFSLLSNAVLHGGNSKKVATLLRGVYHLTKQWILKQHSLGREEDGETPSASLVEDELPAIIHDLEVHADTNRAEHIGRELLFFPRREESPPGSNTPLSDIVLGEQDSTEIFRAALAQFVQSVNLTLSDTLLLQKVLLVVSFVLRSSGVDGARGASVSEAPSARTVFAESGFIAEVVGASSKSTGSSPLRLVHFVTYIAGGQPRHLFLHCDQHL